MLVIPARLKSERLPNKIIADISGKSMLEHVLLRCQKVKRDVEIVVCTDSIEICNLCEKLSFKFLLTSSECTSGTERIASVIKDLMAICWQKNIEELNQEIFLKHLKSTIIINVQGDQPLLDPKIIEQLIDIYLNRLNPPDVITPIYKLEADSIHNPNIVKTLISHKNKVIYFSRSPLPFLRDVEPEDWHKFCSYWGHVGIYGFIGNILNNWFNLPDSPLEKFEKLEQLKLIEAGIEIETFIVNNETISVDTLEQLNYVREIVNNQKNIF